VDVAPAGIADLMAHAVAMGGTAAPTMEAASRRSLCRVPDHAMAADGIAFVIAGGAAGGFATNLIADPKAAFRVVLFLRGQWKSRDNASAYAGRADMVFRGE